MKRILIAALAAGMAFAAAACDETATLDVVPAAEVEATQVTSNQEADGTTEPIEEMTAETSAVLSEAEDASSATPAARAVETAAPAETFAYDDAQSIKVTYYDMAEQKEVETQYPVDDQSDPLAVVDGVAQSLSAALGDNRIEVAGVTFEDGDLTVNFAPSIYSLGLTSGDEQQILDSIADTYFANVEGLRAVYYTVDGRPYESDHIQLAPGEPYRTTES